MKRFFLVLLLFAMTTLVAQAAGNDIVGAVTNLQPGMIVVKTDAGQTTSVMTNDKTVYMKWILQKPWADGPRTDERFLGVGKRVHIEVAKDNPSVARTAWIVVGRVGY